jgi:hypothetical protein
MSFVSIAKEFFMLVKGELDQYTTEKSQIKVNDFKSVSLFTPAHVHFAKYGRGPGKQPPLNEIIKWLSKKGIVKGGNIQGAAFAIAKSIGKNGTINYVANAPNAMEEALNKHMKNYVNKINIEHVDDIEEQSLKLYRAALNSKSKK